MDLVASLGGAALSGLQFSGQMAMAVGGAAGGAMSAGVGAMSRGLGGEASFFDESITVRAPPGQTLSASSFLYPGCVYGWWGGRLPRHATLR